MRSSRPGANSIQASRAWTGSESRLPLNRTVCLPPSSSTVMPIWTSSGVPGSCSALGSGSGGPSSPAAATLSRSACAASEDSDDESTEVVWTRPVNPAPRTTETFIHPVCSAQARKGLRVAEEPAAAPEDRVVPGRAPGRLLFPVLRACRTEDRRGSSFLTGAGRGLDGAPEKGLELRGEIGARAGAGGRWWESFPVAGPQHAHLLPGILHGPLLVASGAEEGGCRLGRRVGR